MRANQNYPHIYSFDNWRHACIGGGICGISDIGRMYPEMNANFLSIPLISEVLHNDIFFEFKNAFIFKTCVWQWYVKP